MRLQNGANPLLELLPDLALLMRRDGSVLAQIGGAGLAGLWPRVQGELAVAWSPAIGALLKQMVRRSISGRRPIEARFEEREQAFHARVVPQGPDRAIAVIRMIQPGSRDESAEQTGEHRRQGMDRRGFMRRLKDLMAVAMLREQPLSVAVLFVDGIPDIAQVIAARVSEQLMNLALLRLSAQIRDAHDAQPQWHLGQIGENTLAVAIETADRDTIETCVTNISGSLREPLTAGDAEFRLTPYAGVAISGMDAAASPEDLLEHARTAAAEARQSASSRVSFYSDTMQLRSLARLDLGRELREAIAEGQIRFRYYGRYELASGRLVTQVGYLRWHHPLRGQLGPADFLRIAGSTGLALTLSRAALQVLTADISAHVGQWDPQVRVSFAPLRDHLFHEAFVSDIERMLVDGAIPAERLELRIAERTFVARDMRHLRVLQRRGVQLVIDRSCCAMSSLTALARTPIAGLQLDGSLINTLCDDEIARKVCRAGINMATALDMMSIAPGLRTPAQRDALVAMGCTHGSGDLFAPAAKHND